jgi:UDP-N-acetylmuramoyl-L-alanyl-D-glutamate--2,6-diaminopimelate ligase
MKIKQIIKKILGERLVLAYHYCVAVLASFYYFFPSKKMVIIGVTGTKGKTSTANFIWSCLNSGGHKTGLISTANIRIGEKEFLNNYHMTMPGRFTIQRFLSQMVDKNVKYCVVETTSEGIKQYRHKGIFYDVAVFTNLYPEHLGSHGGSFEEYKNAKGKIFKGLMNFFADKKINFGIKDGADYFAKNVVNTKDGVVFEVHNSPNPSYQGGEEKYRLNILGDFNVYNGLPAIIISSLFGVDKDLIKAGLANLKFIPGRMERIDEGQNFNVIVDYAHEKQSITAALSAVENLKVEDSKIIILLGAEGGGRDKAKRFSMGETVGKMADFVVVSNVDPYDDDPKLILEDIAGAVEGEGKIRDKDLFVIEDRRSGIAKALSLAKENDVVLITGKGAEQSITIDGKSLPWDDRRVVREEIGKKL